MMFYVYILASGHHGGLYIGVTNDLQRRTREHMLGLNPGYTNRKGIHRLVYFETYTYIQDAIVREKRLKKWNRAWKIRLIENVNPGWEDLFEKL